MKKIYESPKAEIVSYSTPDNVQAGVNVLSSFNFKLNDKNTITYENIDF